MECNVNLMHVLDNISEACIYVNSDWEIVFINKLAESSLRILEQHTGKKILGEIIWDVIPRYKDSYLYKIAYLSFGEQNSKTIELPSEYTGKWIEIKLFPNENGLFVSFRDITHKKESEKKKEYYDKLKVIGEMAAGVAHEVRNPLTTVMGFLQLMSQDKEFESHKNKYKLMIDEINRVNKIITEFLDIAKDKPNKLELCNLNELLEYVFPLLETKAIKEDKVVLLELTVIPELNIDKNEIRQLLLNLINNSLDAMKPNKTVRIITFEENGEVILSIKDEGSGITSSLIDKIGTPFVTTKKEGTGLGLPICYSIAKRNNATIDFASSSEGTTFNVRFSH